MAGEVFVDGPVFLGMHSINDVVRGSCKTFFARMLGGEVCMSLEQVGWCDDIVWQHPRAVQDAYYPFMDTVHTDMSIRRIGYDEKDIDIALDPMLQDLPIPERLLIGMVLHHDGRLYTTNPRLKNRRDLPVMGVPPADEVTFPGHLERLYRVSLALRLSSTDM